MVCLTSLYKFAPLPGKDGPGQNVGAVVREGRQSSVAAQINLQLPERFNSYTIHRLQNAWYFFQHRSHSLNRPLDILQLIKFGGLFSSLVVDWHIFYDSKSFVAI